MGREPRMTLLIRAVVAITAVEGGPTEIGEIQEKSLLTTGNDQLYSQLKTWERKLKVAFDHYHKVRITFEAPVIADLPSIRPAIRLADFKRKRGASQLVWEALGLP